MKAKFYLFILSILFWSQTVFAQIQLPKPINYQIRFSPLALIDPGSPVIQLGGQMLMNDHIGFSLEGGHRYSQIADKLYNRESPVFQRHRYGKIRIEFKYLFKLKRNWFGIGPYGRNYLGLESFIIPMSYRNLKDYIYLDNKPYRYEYSDIKKNILGWCLKSGREVPMGNHLILDNFLGIRVRRVKIDHKPIGLIEEALYEEKDFGFGLSSDREEGIFYRLHLAWGFKIGYIIKQIESQ